MSDDDTLPGSKPSVISADGLEFIKQSEGCKLAAYQDSVGVWTIGYGHTRGIRGADTCTPEDAVQWLKDDLQAVYEAIESMVTVDLSQGQFDALCSFVFNLGAGSLRNSTLLKLLNAGNYDAAQQQFSRWSHAGGVTLAGLVKRRAGEAEMFSENPDGTAA